MSDGCKLQSNFKDNQGGLHNVYANDQNEHLAGLVALQNNAGPIAETGALLLGVTAAAPITAPPAAAPPPPAQVSPLDAYRNGGAGMPATPAQPPQAPVTSAAPQCIHGPREYSEGVGKQSGKPYKVWKCRAPRDQECEPQWIR